MKNIFNYVGETSWTPKEDFWAIKVEKELYPCTYQSDAKKGEYESFVRGRGWKKSKKGILVSKFKGESVSDLNSYLKDWGKECLFYSITGFNTNSDDCVIWAARQEFIVSLSVGFEYVAGLTGKINVLNEKIKQIVKEKHGIDMEEHRYQYTKEKRLVSIDDLFLIRPSYSLMAYFLTKPNLDVIRDDDRLWKHYVNLNGIENESEFPVCMRDRLTFLFSKEISDGYEQIMKNYPMA